jgi:hypothetical protein
MKAKKIGTCNRFSRVWAAIFGCEGKGPFVGWDAPTTMGGSYTPNYSCPTCTACEKTSDAGFVGRFTVSGQHNAHVIRQAFLNQAEALAGVDNYRYQGTVRAKDGRPGLINRRTGKEWFMPSMLTRWTDLTPVGENPIAQAQYG